MTILQRGPLADLVVRPTGGGGQQLTATTGAGSSCGNSEELPRLGPPPVTR